MIVELTWEFRAVDVDREPLTEVVARPPGLGDRQRVVDRSRDTVGQVGDDTVDAHLAVWAGVDLDSVSVDIDRVRGGHCRREDSRRVGPVLVPHLHRRTGVPSSRRERLVYSPSTCASKLDPSKEPRCGSPQPNAVRVVLHFDGSGNTSGWVTVIVAEPWSSTT